MTAKPASAAEAPHPFLKSLYAFARHHLAVANAIVLASGSACAALDFLAPGLPGLILGVRLATASLVALVVLFALAPGLAQGSRYVLRTERRGPFQRHARSEGRSKPAGVWKSVV